MIDPREERLPKWARQEMAHLRQRRDEAEEARDKARLATDPEGSSAIIDNYSEIPIGLGKDTRVTFKTGGRLNVSVYVDPWGRVVVHGSESFLIEAGASNVIQIVEGRR